MQPADKPLQFGIRHLLAAMFVVSLAAALIAPWVRGWSAGQWLNLGTQTAVVVGTFVLYFGGAIGARRVTLSRLGTVLSAFWPRRGGKTPGGRETLT